jgi:hypothetical protein
MSDDTSYKVGYGRPPLHSQFRKGQPRPPRKRRTGAATEAEIIANIRDEKIPVMINGKRVLVSPFEAAVRKVLTSVLTSGRPAELEKLLHIFTRYGGDSTAVNAARSKADAEAAVQKIMEIFDRTIQGDAPGGDAP